MNLIQFKPLKILLLNKPSTGNKKTASRCHIIRYSIFDIRTTKHELRIAILAGMRANRTHLGTFCVPTRGFEVREQHQPLSIPIIDNNNITFTVIMEANFSITSFCLFLCYSFSGIFFHKLSIITLIVFFYQCNKRYLSAASNFTITNERRL